MAKKKAEPLDPTQVAGFSNEQLAEALEQQTYMITSPINWENSRLIKAVAARRLRGKK